MQAEVNAIYEFKQQSKAKALSLAYIPMTDKSLFVYSA